MEPLLVFFGFRHLPPPVQPVAEPFADCAARLCRVLPDGHGRAVAMGKLIEARDAAVYSPAAGWAA